MNRETMTALADPAFKAAYTAALADGERIHGEGHADALSYAETAAHLALEQAAQADARQARLVADAQARHEASNAAPAQPTESQPDPAALAKAGWAKAIAQVNAANGLTAQVPQGAEAHAEALEQQADAGRPTPAPEAVPQDTASAGWKKAADAWNGGQ